MNGSIQNQIIEACKRVIELLETGMTIAEVEQHIKDLKAQNNGGHQYIDDACRQEWSIMELVIKEHKIKVERQSW